MKRFRVLIACALPIFAIFVLYKFGFALLSAKIGVVIVGLCVLIILISLWRLLGFVARLIEISYHSPHEK